MIFTSGISFYKMTPEEREDLKIDNYTINLQNLPWFSSAIYGRFNLLTIELMRYYKADSPKLMKNDLKNEMYIKAPSIIVYEDKSMKTISMEDNIWNKLKDLGSILLTYSLACIATSLYIYITIIASPALILLILKCTPFGRTDHYFEAFKAFPWIGINALILRSSNDQKVRQGYSEICIAMITYFLIMYLIYYIAIIELTGYFFE